MVGGTFINLSITTSFWCLYDTQYRCMRDTCQAEFWLGRVGLIFRYARQEEHCSILRIEGGPGVPAVTLAEKLLEIERPRSSRFAIKTA